MPDSKGKVTKTHKDEDIKSIAEVVRVLLREELDASMQQVTSQFNAVQSELALLSTRIISAEDEIVSLKKEKRVLL